MGSGYWVLDLGSGFRSLGSGLLVLGVGVRVLGPGSCLWSLDSGFGFWVLFQALDSGFGFRLLASVLGLGFDPWILAWGLGSGSGSAFGFWTLDSGLWTLALGFGPKLSGFGPTVDFDHRTVLRAFRPRPSEPAETLPAGVCLSGASRSFPGPGPESPPPDARRQQAQPARLSPGDPARTLHGPPRTALGTASVIRNLGGTCTPAYGMRMAESIGGGE